MLKNIILGVKVATNDDICQGTVPFDNFLDRVLGCRRKAGAESSKLFPIVIL